MADSATPGEGLTGAHALESSRAHYDHHAPQSGSHGVNAWHPADCRSGDAEHQLDHPELARVLDDDGGRNLLSRDYRGNDPEYHLLGPRNTTQRATRQLHQRGYSRAEDADYFDPPLS